MDRIETDYTWDRVSSANQEKIEELAEFLPNKRWHFRVKPAFKQTLQRFKDAGGPEGIRQQWEAQSDSVSLMGYLKTFPCIGEKYSRNMAMDVADERLIDRIAIDHRIESICENIEGWPTGGYESKEQWLIQIGKQMGIDGWFLDRLLYGYYKDIQKLISN